MRTIKGIADLTVHGVREVTQADNSLNRVQSINGRYLSGIHLHNSRAWQVIWRKTVYSSSFPLTGRLANITTPFKIYLRQTRILNGSWQHLKTDETHETIAAIKHGFQLSESNRLGCKEPQLAFLFDRDEILPTEDSMKTICNIPWNL